MQMWVRSLGQEDSPKQGMVTHSVLAWGIPWMDGGALGATVHRMEESDVTGAT